MSRQAVYSSSEEMHEALGFCDAEDCQACCPHDERDHGVCLDCGDEDDGSGDIDDAMDSMEDR